jgi:death-on-curing protein
MIRYLTLEEVVELHRLALEQSGGLEGVRDLGGLESALVQPRMTFDGKELYPSLVEKAVALGFSLVCNHPFLDGNKRIGHAAMETFLILNGWELTADVDEQEQTILRLAAGNLSREEFTSWVHAHLQARPFNPL